MTNRFHLTIFVFGLVLFSVFRVGYVVMPLTIRNEPVELDDAYTYAWKAVNFQNCFFSDCHAEQDLWQQYFAPAENEQLAKARRRAATFTFHRYTFLHELILSLVKATGLSWATTINVVAVIGICCIVLSLAYWLYALWGPAAAGIALAAVGPIMKWQDFQIIVPFVLTLAIAGFIWGLIIRGSRSSLTVVPIGALLLMLMHPIGRVWSVISIILLLSQQKITSFKSRLLVSMVTTLLVATAFVLPKFVKKPLINEWDLPHVASYEWLPHFIATLNSVFGTPFSLQFFFTIFEWLVLLFGFGFSLYLAKGELRRNIFITGISLGALLVVSLLYVWPGYPALLFSRLWTPIALFFFAAGAFAILQLPTVSRRGNVMLARFLKLYALLFSALVAFYWIDQIPKTLNSVTSRTYKQPFELDVNQTVILNAKASAENRVLYLDEEPMIFHLNYGAHRLGAVFLPVVFGSDIEEKWIRKIDFIAGFNRPVQEMSAAMKFPQGIYLDSFKTLDIETQRNFDLSEVQIILEGRNFITGCKIAWESSGQNGEIILSNESRQRFGLSESKKLVTKLTLSMTEGECQAIRLIGLHLEKSQVSNWPWTFEPKFVAQFDGESKERVTYFSIDKMLRDRGLEKYLDNELASHKVLADSGSLILLSKE